MRTSHWSTPPGRTLVPDAQSLARTPAGGSGDASLLARHRPGHGRADPLRGVLDVLVREMGVTQSHPHVAVAEQPRDDRHRDAVHDRVTGQIMSQVVQAHVLDSGLGPDPVPQREVWVMRAFWTARGREHERALPARLAFDDAPCPGAEIHLPRSGLGVGEGDGVAVDCVPAKRENLAPATAGEQEQADDVGLARALRGDSGVAVECAVQAPDFIGGEKAGERGAAVHGDVAGGIDGDVTAGDGELENPAQDAQGVIGATGGGSAVGVEPAQNVVSGDAVERGCAEGGQELACEGGAHAGAR